jgi:methionyl-tRNA synthetase
MALDLENSKLQSATNSLISLARIGNQYLNENEPWKLIKTEKQKAANVFYIASQIVKAIAIVSKPFMPNIASQICEILNLPINKKPLKWDTALQPLPSGHKINKSKPLFKKIDATEEELENKLRTIRQSDN